MSASRRASSRTRNAIWPSPWSRGVCVVVVLYLLANLAYLSSLPLPAIANAPQDRVATAALQAMFGDPG